MSGSSDPTGDEWPMRGGQLNHTGVSTTTPVQGTGLTWNYTTHGGVYSSPAVTSGRVYVGSYDHQVYCLNATTGTRIWNYTTGGSVESSPAVAGGCVYVGSSDNKVYCLNATTGVHVWDYATLNGVSSSPAVSGGRVYVGSQDDKVFCLNANNGSVVWSYTTSGIVGSSPAVSGGLVYVGSYDFKVYCLNATTGAINWSYTTGSWVKSSPAVAGGRVYVGSSDHKVYCLNALTGLYIWSYITNNQVDSSPAVAGGRVYVGSDDDKVYCLNAITGSYMWSYMMNGYVDSSPAVAGGRVYVGNNDNRLYCFNASTGALAWSYPMGSSVGSSPAIASGHVYVGVNGHIYSISMIQITSITHLSDITLSLGATGRISWTITNPTVDNYYYSSKIYTIYRDGSPIVTGSWNSGDSIYITISNLAIGSYNYTIVATDSFGGRIQDTMIITIQSPGFQTQTITLFGAILFLLALIMGISMILASRYRKRNINQGSQYFLRFDSEYFNTIKGKLKKVSILSNSLFFSNLILLSLLVELNVQGIQPLMSVMWPFPLVLIILILSNVILGITSQSIITHKFKEDHAIYVKDVVITIEIFLAMGVGFILAFSVSFGFVNASTLYIPILSLLHLVTFMLINLGGIAVIQRNRVGPWIFPPYSDVQMKALKPRYAHILDKMKEICALATDAPVSIDILAAATGVGPKSLLRKLKYYAKNKLIRVIVQGNRRSTKSVQVQEIYIPLYFTKQPVPNSPDPTALLRAKRRVGLIRLMQGFACMGVFLLVIQFILLSILIPSSIPYSLVASLIPAIFTLIVVGIIRRKLIKGSSVLIKEIYLPALLGMSPIGFPIAIAGFIALRLNRIGPWFLPPLSEAEMNALKPRNKAILMLIKEIGRLTREKAISISELAIATNSDPNKLWRFITRQKNNKLISATLDKKKKTCQITAIRLPFLQDLVAGVTSKTGAPIEPSSTKGISATALRLGPSSLKLKAWEKEMDQGKNFEASRELDQAIQAYERASVKSSQAGLGEQTLEAQRAIQHLTDTRNRENADKGIKQAEDAVMRRAWIQAMECYKKAIPHLEGLGDMDRLDQIKVAIKNISQTWQNEIEQNFCTGQSLVEEGQVTIGLEKMSQECKRARDAGFEGLTSKLNETIGIEQQKIKERQKQLIKEMLAFEAEHGYFATRKDMIGILHTNIDEANFLANLGDPMESYVVSDIMLIKPIAERALREYEAPCLYDLVVGMDVDYSIARKVGKYLLDENLVSDFPRFRNISETVSPTSVEESTEPEVVTRKCIVCKSKLGKAHFTCDCSAEYHFRCARAIAENGELCLQCGNAITGVPPIDDDGTIIILAEEIDELSRQLDDALDTDDLLHKDPGLKLKRIEASVRFATGTAASEDVREILGEYQDKLFSRINSLQDELTKKTEREREAVMMEVRSMKDIAMIATELAMFAEKPGDIEGIVKKVIKSGWPDVKKDAWAVAARHVLEDWQILKPSLWQKAGRALESILGRFIGDSTAGLVSNGIKTLWSWLATNLS